MTKTPGEQIAIALLETPARRRFDVVLERKAGPVLVAPPNPMPVGRIISGPVLPLRIRNLIPGGTTEADSIGYARETSITNSPVVPIGPGGLKAQMDMTYETVTSPVRTIPAYLKISAQLWEDYAAFQSWVDARLLYSLSIAEEKQLLNGNGVAPNLQGLMAVAIAVTGVGANLIAGVTAGVAQIFGFGYIADGIVLNPNDWGKALGALGSPALIGNPLSLWGIPLVLSAAMASGSYLVGQFNPNCQIFDRDDAAVEVATQNQDDFVRDLLTVRGEERLAFAIYQPGAFAKGTFTP